MSTENRTLQITTQVKDLASKSLRGLGTSLVSLKSIGGGALKALGGSLQRVTELLASFGIAFSVSQAATFFREVVTGLDDIGDAAASLGTTAESMSALKFATDATGSEFDAVVESLRKFLTGLDKAREKGDATSQVLGELGINVSTFATGQADVVAILEELGARLDRVSDSSQRAAILTDLFGRSGLRMGELMQDGGKKLRSLVDDAQKLGVVFSREDLERAGAFNDEIGKLKATFRAIAETIVVDVAPALRDWLEQFRKSVVNNSGGIRAAVLGIGIAFLDISTTVVSAISKIGLNLETLNKGITKVIDGLQTLGTLGNVITLDAFSGRKQPDGVEMNKLIDQELRKSRTEFMRDNGGEPGASSTGDSVSQLQELRKSLDQARQAAMVDSTRTPRDLSVAGPKLKDQLPDPSLWDKFREGANRAIEKTRDLGKVAADAGEQFMGSFQQGIEDVFMNIATGSMKAGQALKEFAKGVLKAIAQVMAKLAAAKIVSTLFGGTAQALGGVVPGNMGPPVEGSFALGGVQRFAAGGIARRPTLAMFGEGRGAEAFVPLPDGRSIPVSFLGGGGGAGQVNVTIHALDGASVAQVLTKNKRLLSNLAVNDLSHGQAIRNAVRQVR